MASKIRPLVIIFSLVMLLSGVGCGLNLLLGGIGQDKPCVEPCSSAANYKYKAMAASLDADYFPMYYQSDLFDQIGEVQSAATDEKTDQNGLNNEAVNGKSYDTILAYSGGTATAMTVLANYEEYHVTCDTLILISPMKAGLTDELYNRIEAKVESCGLDKECLVKAGILSDLDPARRQAEESYRNQVATILDPMNNPPVVKRILVITSPQDELMEIEGEISMGKVSIPYDINFVSDIFQVRNFEEYTKRDWSAINPDITVTPISVELPEFENNGWGAHQNLFFEYARTHLSKTEGDAVEFNPEGSPTAIVQAFQVKPLSLIAGESFKIDYTVSDDGGSGLKQIELWRKDEKNDWQQIGTNTLAGETAKVSDSFTDSPSAPGKYWYGVHVVDNAGNWNDEKNSSTNNQLGVYGPIEVIVTDSQSVQEQPEINLVTLKLYAHDGSADGPIIPGAQVNSKDALGNRFEQTTDCNGYVTITGIPGTWSFSASADGYKTSNWDQEITKTDRKDAFLQKSEAQRESSESVASATEGSETNVDSELGDLINALKDKDAEVRLKSAESLGKFANAMSVDSLIEALRFDEDGEVRQKAAWALGQIDDARTIDPLSYASVKDVQGYVRSEAYDALQKSMIGGNKVDVRSTDPIIRALKDEDPGVRFNAAEALGQIKNATAVDSLIETLKNDEDGEVRQKAAWALGEIGDVRAVDPLNYASMKDTQGYVQGEAKTALEKLGVLAG